VYLREHDPKVLDPNTTHAFQFNSHGRRYPDLAAKRSSFVTVWNQMLKPVSGTSASTPVVASVVALLNDYLIASKSPPLGFLNPWLYAVGREGMNDITSRSNKGYGTRGFEAVKGWDPVTGFRTPVQIFILRVGVLLT
jgi:tripeptidyl-peptidase I